MSIRILVACDTEHSATKEIAERIGRVLRDAELGVDVQNVKRVSAPDS